MDPEAWLSEYNGTALNYLVAATNASPSDMYLNYSIYIRTIHLSEIGPKLFEVFMFCATTCDKADILTSRAALGYFFCFFAAGWPLAVRPNRLLKSSTMCFRPSRRGTLGSQPSVVFALVMSGLRKRKGA